MTLPEAHKEHGEYIAHTADAVFIIGLKTAGEGRQVADCIYHWDSVEDQMVDEVLRRLVVNSSLDWDDLHDRIDQMESIEQVEQVLYGDDEQGGDDP